MRQGLNRICMFVPPADGGMARYARELLTALVEHPGAGYEYELVTSRDLDPQFTSDRYAVHAILPPLSHRGTFRTRAGWVANRLVHYRRRDRHFLDWLRTRADVTAVHFQELTPWGAAPLFRRVREMGKRVFYTVHNVISHRYPALVPKRVIDGCRRRTCLGCDGLFVHTQNLAQQLSRSLGEPHPPIHVVPHGVWNVPDGADRPALEERLKWKRLLFFGSIRRNKGLHLLLDAAQSLPEFGVTVAGEPLEEEYHRCEIIPRVRRLRAAGMRVDLLDRWTPDERIPELFRGHSAVVMPYTSEFVAQSGVLFMALAYEVPVVASRAGGLGDFLRQYKVGVTFDHEGPQSLAEAVRRLHTTVRADELSQEIQAARRRHSWRQAAEATIAGYSVGSESLNDFSPATGKHDRPLQAISAA